MNENPHIRYQEQHLIGARTCGVKWAPEPDGGYRLSLTPRYPGKLKEYEPGLWIADELPAKGNTSGIYFYSLPQHPVAFDPNYVTILVAAGGLVVLHEDFIGRAEVIRPLAIVDGWTGWASRATAVISHRDGGGTPEVYLQWQPGSGTAMRLSPGEVLHQLSLRYNIPVIKPQEAYAFVYQEEAV